MNKKADKKTQEDTIKELAELLDLESIQFPYIFHPTSDLKFLAEFENILSNLSLGKYFRNAIKEQLLYRNLRQKDLKEDNFDENEKFKDMYITLEQLVTDTSFPNDDCETISKFPIRSRNINCNGSTRSTDLKNEIFHTFLNLVSALYRDKKIRPDIHLRSFLRKKGILKKYIYSLSAQEICSINPRLRNSEYLPKGYLPPGLIKESTTNSSDFAFRWKLQVLLLSLLPKEYGHVKYSVLIKVFFPGLQNISDPDDESIYSFKRRFSEARHSFKISKNQISKK